MPENLAQHSPQSGGGCAGDCRHCHTAPDNPDAPLQGLRFSAASITAFLLPLSSALAGGLICDGSTDQRTLGVIAGLAIGASIAWTLNRFLCRESKQQNADVRVAACGARQSLPGGVAADMNTRLDPESTTRSHDG